MNWGNKETLSIFIASVLIGLSFLVGGFYLFGADLNLIQMNLRYLQPSVTTYASSFIFGLSFLAVAYFLFKNRNK